MVVTETPDWRVLGGRRARKRRGVLEKGEKGLIEAEMEVR